MGRHRIALIPGDGIGPEVIAEGVKCLQALTRRFDLRLEFEEFPWGAGYYQSHGAAFPANGLQELRAFHAIYLGAVGDPRRVPDRLVTENGLVQNIRRQFRQYVNLRPAQLLPSIPSPLKQPGEVDMVIVRENTEGEYAWIGGRHYGETDEEVAVQSALFTRRGVERTMRFAFGEARRRNRLRKVTSVTKSNAIRFTMGLWDDVFAQVAREYPEIQVEEVYVDAMAMYLINRPHTFDVVVASNLFGDILSDEAAAIQGGIGLAAGGNINVDRSYPSMFEPIHGSAPDIAGKGIANPVATLLAARMMLDYLAEDAAARHLQKAVEAVLAAGVVRTSDLGGTSDTAAVGDAVCRYILETAKE